MLAGCCWRNIDCPVWPYGRYACPFDVAATRVPRRISDGDVVHAPIEASALHYFAIDIGR